MNNKLTILFVLATITIAAAPAFAEGMKSKHSKHMATTSSTTVSSTSDLGQINPSFGRTNTAGPNSARSTELSPDGTSLTGSMINNSNNLPSAQPRVGQ